MNDVSTDTICAVATAPGRAGVAVVRISGGRAFDVARKLTGRPLPEARRASLRTFFDPDTQDPIDRGLLLVFPGPASFTGDDIAEFQIHGGSAVLSDLVSALTSGCQVRIAEPGEFSRRAFYNGKLDLTEVEGLADLIAAETRVQRRLAYTQLNGMLGALYDGWRERLIRAGALLEAGIDFPDEDLPDETLATARPILRELSDDIADHLAAGVRGERIRDGLVVALVGPPNAGKSTLVNTLARREVAIVTEEPGTTRDVLEVHLDLGGYPVTVLDLAGLREAEGIVEAEGIRRALERAQRADLRIFLSEAGQEQDWIAMGVLPRPGDLHCQSKSDLHPCPVSEKALRISSNSGAGLEDLISVLKERAADLMAVGEEAVLTRSRHRGHLERTSEHLHSALSSDLVAPELVAEEVRLATQELGRLTGRVDVEDLLDVIFAEFCLGK